MTKRRNTTHFIVNITRETKESLIL